MRSSLLALVSVALLLTVPSRAQVQEGSPVFRTQVNLVSLTAVVRDGHGRIVPSLPLSALQVFEDGWRVRLIDVLPNRETPANVALLVDGSGSMRVHNAFTLARGAAERILDSLITGRDQAALYSFDSRVLALQPLTPRLSEVKRALDDLSTWGSTSLYDAIAGVAGKLRGLSNTRRAVVVFTDGQDTTSIESPADVASIASALDVPVYAFVLDRSAARGGDDEGPEPPLAALARETGGLYFAATDPTTLAAHATTVIEELRHQYAITFEASTKPGWRALEVRTPGQAYKVRARGWYWAGDGPPSPRSDGTLTGPSR